MKPWFMVEQVDAVEGLNRLAEGSVDLIITDPAYESLERHRAVGTTTRLTKAWFPIFPNDRFDELMTAASFALKPGAHLYTLSDDETSYVIAESARAAGLRLWNRLPWDKRRTPDDKGMGYHYRNIFEWVLFFQKLPTELRALNDRSQVNFLQYPKVTNGYPTEKPVGLWKQLVENSTQPGQVVVDPFCGSGSSGQATLELGRHYVGFDILQDAVTATESRLFEHGRRVARPPSTGQLRLFGA